MDTTYRAYSTYNALRIRVCIVSVLYGACYGALRHARCKQTMRSRIPDMNEKELEKMAFLQRCLHCLHVVGERIEVSANHTHSSFRPPRKSYHTCMHSVFSTSHIPPLNPHAYHIIHACTPCWLSVFLKRGLIRKGKLSYLV